MYNFVIDEVMPIFFRKDKHATFLHFYL